MKKTISDQLAAHVTSRGYRANIVSGRMGTSILSSGAEATITSNNTSVLIVATGISACIITSGEFSRISVMGFGSTVLSDGDQAEISLNSNESTVISAGKNAVITSSGFGNKVKAIVGSWITLTEYDGDIFCPGHPIYIKTEQVDGERIKADTFYMIRNSEFTICDETYPHDGSCVHENEIVEGGIS